MNSEQALKGAKAENAWPSFPRAPKATTSAEGGGARTEAKPGIFGRLAE